MAGLLGCNLLRCGLLRRCRFLGAGSLLARTAFFAGAFLGDHVLCRGLLGRDGLFRRRLGHFLGATAFWLAPWRQRPAWRLPCFAADLATVRPGLAGALLALFTALPFADAVFDAAALASFALVRSLALLRLGGGRTTCRFRHIPSPLLAVAAGCYSPCVLHQQARFWNTCTTTCRQPFRQRECPDPIDTVAAPFVQALAQPPARAALSLLPQLLRLCTDCRHPLRSLARQPAGRLAAAALPAPVQRR